MPTPSYDTPISTHKYAVRTDMLKAASFQKINSQDWSNGQATITTQAVRYSVDEWFEKFVADNIPVSDKVEANKGLRYNTGKPKWALLDFKSLEPMVKVMEYGAAKYAPHNWKKGMSHTEISECLMRHLVAWLSGEDIDPESGESHIAHMQCNAMFLQYNIKNHPDLDDRFKPAV